jgi:predicted ArsR family transcriptional regulator
VETPSSTRTRVARAVLENGPSTASDLAQGLGLTPAGVRRHLDALCAEGLLASREQRAYGPRGRGRPARVFALTDLGRGAFFQAYDGLATDALRLLAEVGGDAAVERFARERVASLEERCRTALDEQPERDRSEVLAEALSTEGYAASARSAPGGQQVCQHHCPVAHVAQEFPQLCEAETQVFARLLGTHVQRLATIAHGDGVCTTHVPHVPSASTSSTTSRTGGSAV